jgi:site-specific recombinase XerD
MTTDSPLLNEYLDTLSSKAPGTLIEYSRALTAFTTWLSQRPGSDGTFQPDQFTRTATETYLGLLEQQGYSPSYRTLVKSALSGFAVWLLEEKELLRRNPTRGVEIAAQPLLAPRVLTDEQRFILKNLVERDGNPRSEALFALGYYAGCRVSDVSWLLLANTHLSQRAGWLKVGHKGGKLREIDLAKPARTALVDYLASGQRKADSAYVFTSQRAERLTEAGIHHWFRGLKAEAKKAEYDLIADISYHDLRHDFAHRARAVGWTLEEVAYYLGHITKRGTPALQTTARYTQASREQGREKLKSLER